MTVSDVAICNIALSRIGISQTIASLADPSTEARQCTLHYAPTRDAILREFAWAFATSYETLALVEETPNDDWGYSYQFPAGIITVRRIVSGAGRVETPPIPFAIGQGAQGKLVFTDQADAVAECTKAMTNPALFDPAFVEALSWRLAIELSMPLRASDTTRQAASQGYQVAIAAARAAAANESAEDPPADAEWIRARA